MIIHVEKEKTRMHINTHEYEKIIFMKIRGSFMIIYVKKLKHELP